MKRDYSYMINNQFAKGNKPNQTSFRKETIPWNKGTKGICKPNEGSFKKGQGSLKKKSLGTITIRVDKNKVKRRFIKIAEPDKWQEYAKYLWEKQFGKLLKGDVTHHIDGNRLNDKVENIIALPRSDHPIFHSRWGLREMNEKQIRFYKSRYIKQEYIDMSYKRIARVQQRIF